jgi:hypothetical protein
MSEPDEKLQELTRRERRLPSLDSLLDTWQAAGLRLSFERPGEITVRPKGVLSDEGRAALIGWKPFILDFIAHQPEGHKQFTGLIYCAADGTYCMFCRQTVRESRGGACPRCSDVRSELIQRLETGQGPERV